MRAFLVFVALVGFGAVVGAIVVGVRVFDGTVVDRPYERGLAWDEEQSLRKKAALSVAIENKKFRTGSNLLVVRVLHDGKTVADEAVALRVIRPGTEVTERRYTAVRQDDGSYAATVEFPLPGRWEVAIVITRGGFPLAYRHVIHAAGQPTDYGEDGSDIDCDIDSGPCTVDLGEERAVSFEIGPRPVRSMSNLMFRVRLSGPFDPAPESLVVHLDMPGMYMGENRVVLESGGAGLYEGYGVIVRCPSGSTVWRATVDGPPADPVSFTFRVDAR